jgi:hypothetical protein
MEEAIRWFSQESVSWSGLWFWKMCLVGLGRKDAAWE